MPPTANDALALPHVPALHGGLERSSTPRSGGPRRSSPAPRPLATAALLLAALTTSPATLAQTPGTPPRPGFADPANPGGFQDPNAFTAMAAGAFPEPTTPATYREFRIKFPPAAMTAPAAASPDLAFGGMMGFPSPFAPAGPVYNALQQALSSDPSVPAQVLARLLNRPVAATSELRPYNISVVPAPSDDPNETALQIAITPATERPPGIPTAPPPVPADAYADALADIVKQRTLAAWRDQKRAAEQSVAAHQRTNQLAMQQLDDHRRRIQRLQHDLRQSTGRADLSPAGIRTVIADLETESQKLDLDVAGLNARREALTEALAEQTDRTAKAAATDPVAAELQKVVDIRQKQLEVIRSSPSPALRAKLAIARDELESRRTRLAEIQQSRGENNPDVLKAKTDVARAEAQLAALQSQTDSPDTRDDVQAAATALAEASARLAERRLAATASADTLAALNRELLTLTIDLREKKARLDLVTKKLNAYASATEDAQSLESLLTTLPQRQKAVDDATAALQSAAPSLDAFKEPPTITVTTPATTQPAPR